MNEIYWNDLPNGRHSMKVSPCAGEWAVEMIDLLTFERIGWYGLHRDYADALWVADETVAFAFDLTN